MQTQETTRRFLPLLALLVNCTLTAFAGAEPDTNDAPKPLPPEIVKAWRDAGAEVGWMKKNAGFVDDLDQEQGEAGDIPAFQFSFTVWKERAIEKLPDP